MEVVNSHVPVPMWGKDHWSTLLYAESCAVDNKGFLDPRRMRCDYDIHPEFVVNKHTSNWKKKYPTRTVDGKICNHDDWNCIEDMQVAGFLKINNGQGLANNRWARQKIKLTDSGWQIAMQLRRWRAEGNRVAEFAWEES